MANEFNIFELNEEGTHKAAEISRLYTTLLSVQENLIPAGKYRAQITEKLQAAHQTFIKALGELKAFRKED